MRMIVVTGPTKKDVRIRNRPSVLAMNLNVLMEPLVYPLNGNAIWNRVRIFTINRRKKNWKSFYINKYILTDCDGGEDEKCSPDDIDKSSKRTCAEDEFKCRDGRCILVWKKNYLKISNVKSRVMSFIFDFFFSEIGFVTE